MQGLPQAEKEFYEDEANLVSDLPMLWDQPKEEGIGGSRQEYAKFMKRLIEVDMVEMGMKRAKATNSIFFLRKPNGKLRFIISALRANELLARPEYVDLGGPQVIAACQSQKLPL